MPPRSRRLPRPSPGHSVVVHFDVPTANGREIVSVDWHGKRGPLPLGSILADGPLIKVDVGRDGNYFADYGVPGETFPSIDQLIHAACDCFLLRRRDLPPCEEQQHVGGTVSAQKLQEPDVSPLKNLLGAVTLEESSITATSSSSPRDTIWFREEHQWGLTFYTRIDLGGSFHTYPHVGGPFQSLQEAGNAIDRYLHDHRDPKMCMDPNKVSPMEMAIQQTLYRPDGTRTNKPIDESRSPERQLAQALVDKYNEDHNLLGDLAYELKDVVCFQSIRDCHSDMIYEHINFTAKTKGAGIDNLFFAEVIFILGKHGELLVSCICTVNPFDNGNCNGCKNHGNDMKHPNDADFKGGSVKEAYWPSGGFTMDCSGTGGCNSVWGDSDDDLEAQTESLRYLYEGMDDPRVMEKWMEPPKLDYGALAGDESWRSLVSFDAARYEAYKAYKQFQRED